METGAYSKYLSWAHRDAKRHSDLLARIDAEHLDDRSVRELGKLREEFDGIRRILDGWSIEGEQRPNDRSLDDAYRFLEELGKKEAAVQPKLQEGIDRYEAIAYNPRVTPAIFSKARQEFEQTRALLLAYDPSRSEELETLDSRVKSLVTQTIMTRQQDSGIVIPLLPEAKRLEAYSSLKERFDERSEKLHEPSYRPERWGSKGLLEGLVKELGEIRREAERQGFDFSVEAKSSEQKAKALYKESGAIQRRRALKGGLGALTVGATLTLGALVSDWIAHSRAEATRQEAEAQQVYLAALEEKAAYLDKVTATLERETNALKERNNALRAAEYRPAATSTVAVAQPAVYRTSPSRPKPVNVARIPSTPYEAPATGEAPSSVLNLMAARGSLDYVIHLDRDGRQARVYDVSDGAPRPVYTARCSFGRVPGRKQYAGDKRTEEGVFSIELAVLGNHGELYGDGFINLGGEQFPGLQIAGADLPERIAAIENGYDSTNGGCVVKNEDIRAIASYVQSRGISNGAVIIESRRRS